MKPFRIEIPQADIDDLRRRLADTRWPHEPGADGWERGVPQSYLRELADYWGSGYDWRAAEARLNEFPQFVTEIDGATVHFLHVRSPEPDATPLVLTHGWPGSFLEYVDLVGPLTDPRAHGGDPADALHVVVPSLPGYGFSGPLTGTGWGVPRIAGAWAELMNRLGYDRYVAQGTDFGSWVTVALAAMDVPHAIGAHVNFLITPPPGDPRELGALDEDTGRRLARLARFVDDESGYMKIQATRPVTLSYALTDSPVGQLAWIVEKFKEWTDSGKSPEDAVDRDRLLTNVSLYWFTRTAGSSAQLYHETADMLPVSAAPRQQPPVPVPLGVAVFPHDPSQPVRAWADQAFPNIVQWTEHDRGGHFPGLEQPGLLVDDIRRFARTLGGA
ncbi:epoxide hydrolase family protein [Micromonospora sp. LOL_025]|uniref:epoxide hydrolase family protein n=1 Tax=Micromonospora sp. LOL_025 TaxID=3345413 RepID=UPI003A85A38B